MRLFIALTPHPMIRQQMSGYLAACPQSADIRWTRPETLHCTLLFIGDVNDNHVSFIEQGLGQALQGAPAIACTLATTGFFKNKEGAVLWVGIEPPGPVVALAARIREALPGCGDGKPMQPHCTIGRARGKRDWKNILPPFTPITWQIDRVFLVQSRLLPEGAVYTVKQEYHLSQIDPP